MKLDWDNFQEGINNICWTWCWQKSYIGWKSKKQSHRKSIAEEKSSEKEHQVTSQKLKTLRGHSGCDRCRGVRVTQISDKKWYLGEGSVCKKVNAKKIRKFLNYSNRHDAKKEIMRSKIIKPPLAPCPKAAKIKISTLSSFESLVPLQTIETLNLNFFHWKAFVFSFCSLKTNHFKTQLHCQNCWHNKNTKHKGEKLVRPYRDGG